MDGAGRSLRHIQMKSLGGPQESLAGFQKLFLFLVPMNFQQYWKAKLERALSFRFQFGKITVCPELLHSQFYYYRLSTSSTQRLFRQTVDSSIRNGSYTNWTTYVRIFPGPNLQVAYDLYIKQLLINQRTINDPL